MYNKKKIKERDVDPSTTSITMRTESDRLIDNRPKS